MELVSALTKGQWKS